MISLAFIYQKINKIKIVFNAPEKFMYAKNIKNYNI